MPTELTAEEKQLLTDIMNDKFAAGPFCGMVFNAVSSCAIDATMKPQEVDVVPFIKTALQIRLQARELIK